MDKLKKINQFLFWDINLKKIDPEKNKNFIIHRILSYGTMDDIRELFKIYNKETIKKEFLKAQPGIYYPNILKLCQHLLGIKEIDKDKYLKKIR